MQDWVTLNFCASIKSLVSITGASSSCDSGARHKHRTRPSVSCYFLPPRSSHEERSWPLPWPGWHRHTVQLQGILQVQHGSMQDSARGPPTSDLFANKKEKETLVFQIVSEDLSCSWNLCLKFVCGSILDHILLSTFYYSTVSLWVNSSSHFTVYNLAKNTFSFSILCVGTSHLYQRDEIVKMN